ncbi:MAG: hypothetical protein Q7S21_01165 [archaeon]|nr:hypothetical protein [archaeon]
MNKSIFLAVTLLGLVFISSSVSAGFSLNVFLCDYFNSCDHGYRPVYNYPAYYNYNDIYFDPPVYRNSYVVYPSYNYSNRIYAPMYPSYYGRSINPSLREINYGNYAYPSTNYPTYDNPSYYYTSTTNCTSSKCYYN